MTAFWLGAAGYALLMPAMQNTLLLLTLSRVELAVRAVAIALASNAVVGFICSRAIYYPMPPPDWSPARCALRHHLARRPPRRRASSTTTTYAAF